MLFDSSRNKCIFQVLKILSNSNATYSELFKKTKFSHITLQNVLKEMLKKEIIIKDEKYSITEKGSNFLKLLSKINNF